MAPHTWYLVRHGETEWNAAARVQGQWDSPLTPLGRTHAEASSRLLARLGVDAIFASPLGRVRETVAIVARAVPLPVTFDDRLKEWAAGAWSGELYADIKTKWPDEWRRWRADRYANRSPGGENFSDLSVRAEAFLAEAAASPARRIAILGHGFMNRALAGALLSLSPAEALRIHQHNDTLIRVIVEHDTALADHFVGGDGPQPGLPEDHSPRNPPIV